MTCAPMCASLWQVAKPMPALPPVTMHTCGGARRGRRRTWSPAASSPRQHVCIRGCSEGSVRSIPMSSSSSSSSGNGGVQWVFCKHVMAAEAPCIALVAPLAHRKLPAA
eukprot:360457-Chlamydomonas_euryale.AAC.6